MEIRDVHGAGRPTPLPPGDRGKPKGQRQAADTNGDRIDISPGARRAALADQLVGRVRALPDTRPAAIAAARAALERGELDTQAAIDDAVRAMRPAS